MIGVDVGSTRVKAVVVDLDGTELASATDATPWVVDGNSVEMDANALIDVVRAVVAVGVAEQRGDDTVVAVGVTGVGESGRAPRPRTDSRRRRSSPGTTSAATSS